MQENNLYFFSMYGFLDAAADTQWVRISPAMDSYEGAPELPGYLVTVENAGNGWQVIMQNHLVELSGGFYALNSWTDMDLQHGETYRITAENPEGNVSEVVVEIPEDFPTPVFIEDRSVRTSNPLENRVLIRDVENLADFQTIWYVELRAPGLSERLKFSFSYRNTAQHISGFGDYLVVTFRPEYEEDYIMNETGADVIQDAELKILHRQVFIASAGPGWLEDIHAMSDIEYSLPEGASNVENGLGYVAGITSKIIPYRTCRDEQIVIIACPEEEPFW